MSEMKMLPMREKWVGYRKPPLNLIPPGWKAVRLRDVASFKAGGSLGLTMSDYKQQGTPAYTAEGQNGFTAITEFNAKAVIVSSIGALCGKSFYASGRFTTLANTQVIFGDEEKISNYFLWSLLNDRAYWAPYQTAQPFIRPSDIQKSWIPLPETRDEQTRIAETLKTADDHIRAIEEEIKKAERVAIALDQVHFAVAPPEVKYPYHYGTARTIPNGWDSMPLGKFADVVSGITLNQDREAADNGVRYLTVINIHRGRIDLTEVRHLELRGDEAETKRIAVGDVMVIEGHANPAEIGRAALATEKEQGMSFQNHLFRVRVMDSDQIRPRFLVRALNSSRVRRHWVATANTSSGLNTINRTGLRRLILPVPKPTEQDAIVERLDAIEAVTTALNSQLIAARRVKQSLLQNLLTGRIRLKQ
jgi:type I restriction enzyme S subunit